MVRIRLTSSCSCSVVMSLTNGFSLMDRRWWIGASGASGSFGLSWLCILWCYIFEVDTVKDFYNFWSVFFVPHSWDFEFLTLFEESLKEKVDEGLS